MTLPNEAASDVTQADRDAAAKCYAEFVGFEEAIDEGDWMAGHFASHRIAATRKPDPSALVEVKTAFVFAFAAGYDCAENTSRQCILAMDDAWADYCAVLAEATTTQIEGEKA